ncbi:MAG: radical SAM protein [Verrucomicrobiae bacterium]|nr:radical SAM protein [Verrucomicrobiae bacterium]
MTVPLPPTPAGEDPTAWIVGLRPDLNGSRRALPADRPQGWIEEVEPDDSGEAVRFLTVFLTNRECPWRCLMCDLWHHTTLEPVPPGAIVTQIRTARLGRGDVPGLKLYNAGSFFDAGAVPLADHDAIASEIGTHRRVVVECHPRLVGPRIPTFAGKINPAALEVALGLETVHPEVLSRLNKRIRVADFVRASKSLRSDGVAVRAFVLVKPPFLDEDAALEWAVRSSEVALEAGAGVVSLIPTRGGEGALRELERLGLFREPGLALIEEAFDRVMALGRGRVFMDLWELDRFGAHETGFLERRDRMERMNRLQQILPRIGAAAAAPAVTRDS